MSSIYDLIPVAKGTVAHKTGSGKLETNRRFTPGATVLGERQQGKGKQLAFSRGTPNYVSRSSFLSAPLWVFVIYQQLSMIAKRARDIKVKMELLNYNNR